MLNLVVGLQLLTIITPNAYASPRIKILRG